MKKQTKTKKTKTKRKNNNLSCSGGVGQLTLPGICPALGSCGGCRYPQDDYPAYLSAKEKLIRQYLGTYKPLPLLPMEDPYYYRGKVHASFRKKGGQILCGLYEEESHRLVPVSDCLLEDLDLQAVLLTIQELVRSFRWTIYDEKSRSGLLRHVLLRKAPASGEILVALVVTDLIVPGKAQFARALMDAHPAVKSVILNLNARRTSMVLGEKSVCVRGRAYIMDEILGKKFRISAESFYQVNTRQTEKLYALAIAGAKLRPDKRVLDACCGVGTLGILSAPCCREVYGVEINRRAIEDARANARLNKISNIHFQADDITRYLIETPLHFDCIIVDPPRAGLSEDFIRALQKRPPERLVYVSCHLKSLSQNLKALSQTFHIESVQPVDMFPWTGHVETVVLLSKTDVDKHVKEC